MLYVCIKCEKIIHCDLSASCDYCTFGPAKSELCLKIWQKFGDGEFLTCEECYAKNKETEKKIIFVISGDGRYAAHQAIRRIGKQIMVADDSVMMASMLKKSCAVPLDLRLDDFYIDPPTRREFKEHLQGFKDRHTTQAKHALKRLIPKQRR